MGGSVRIGRIFGIDIEVSYSWLIIFVLLTFSLATGVFPQALPHADSVLYWVLGAVASLLLFASVLVHELAHSVVARARGLPVKNITLFIFGGVSNIQEEPRTPGIEFQMAVVGPLTSIVIGVISWVLGSLLVPASQGIATVLLYVGVANVLLGIFNLIPGFPLDGGRVLRSILWKITGSLQRATRWATRVGEVVAFLFIIWGIFQVFTGNLIGGIWIGFIGWFLLNAAQQANTEVQMQALLRGVRVADLMNPYPSFIPPETSLDEAVNHYMLPRGLRAIVVTDQNGEPLGLLSATDIRDIPRDQWAGTPVTRVMVPRDRLYTVAPTQRISDVLSLMANHDVNQLPVLDNGRLVGMITRDAIVHYLEARRTFGGMPPRRPATPVTPSAPPQPS